MGLMGSPPVILASELVFLDVSQPFFQPNGGLEIHRVTYAAFMGPPVPGVEIRYLGAANCTMQSGGWPPFADSTSFDQNVASYLRAKVTVEHRSDPGTWMQIGVRRNAKNPTMNGPIIGVDTLTVEVDLSESVTILARERDSGASDLGGMVSIGQLAEVLVTCIRDNASRSNPPIGRVRIRFLGAREASRHNGVYRVPAP
jgi:hypothetical protein